MEPVLVPPTVPLVIHDAGTGEDLVTVPAGKYPVIPRKGDTVFISFEMYDERYVVVEAQHNLSTIDPGATFIQVLVELDDDIPEDDNEALDVEAAEAAEFEAAETAEFGPSPLRSSRPFREIEASASEQMLGLLPPMLSEESPDNLPEVLAQVSAILRSRLDKGNMPEAWEQWREFIEKYAKLTEA